jgi:serine-threonine kinase receptor-associated protein
VSGDWIGTFIGHKGAVWSAKLDNKGLRAATGAADFTAKLWDAITGKEIQEFSHKHIVKNVEFSAEGASLATCGHEGLLRVFDIGSGELNHEITHDPSNKLQLNKVVWGVDPQTVLTGASDGTGIFTYPPSLSLSCVS